MKNFSSAVLSMFFFVGCNKSSLISNPVSALTATKTPATAFSISFSPTTGSQSTTLLGNAVNPLYAGAPYKLSFEVANSPPSATFTMSIAATGLTLANPNTNISSVAIALNNHSTIAFTAPSVFGTYKLILSAYHADRTLASQTTVPLTVMCASPNPNFTAANFSGVGVNVLGTYSTAAPNIVSFQVVGGGQNGVAALVPPASPPSYGSGYFCQLDQNGIGIIDTSARDCTQPFNDQDKSTFVNALGRRSIGVLITDISCYNSVVVQVPTDTVPAGNNIPVPSRGAVPFNWALPSGNVWIYGELASANANPNPADPRVYNINYLSYANFAAQANPQVANSDLAASYYEIPGGQQGIFAISAKHLYKMPTSINNGMSVTVQGIVDNFPRTLWNPASPVGPQIPPDSPTLDFTNAYLCATFTTDIGGTQSSQAVLQFGNSNGACSQSATTCVIDSIGAIPQPFGAGTCEGTNGLSYNTVMMEVYGEFHCNASVPGDSGYNGVFIRNGFFDGYAGASDPCPGPGPPGGSVPPPF